MGRVSELERVDQRTETDCLRCCLATVLGLPYEDVPDFVNEYPGQWADEMSRWLAARGLSMVRVQATGDGELLHSIYAGPSSFWIASGQSERGRNHAVVYRGAEPYHDPHASRAYLETITAATVIAMENAANGPPMSAAVPSVVDRNGNSAVAYVWLDAPDEHGHRYRLEVHVEGEIERGGAVTWPLAIAAALEVADEHGVPPWGVEVKLHAPSTREQAGTCDACDHPHRVHSGGGVRRCWMPGCDCKRGRPTSLTSFRMRRLDALRAEIKAQMQIDHGIETCTICSRPINTRRQSGWQSDDDGIYLHTSCWTDADNGVEPSVDELDALDADVRREPTDTPADEKDASIAVASAYRHIELGQALGELAAQVERLRRTPCPTQGFGHSSKDVRRALIRELAEYHQATSDRDRSDEAGDILGAAINLAISTGDPLAVIGGVTAKLRRRIDVVDGGGTWLGAKRAERTSCE